MITEVDLNALLSFHNLNKYDITLCLAKYIYNIPFGVVEFKKNNEFDKISEKPLLTKFILSGVYCINKEIFKYVGDKKLDMPDLIEKTKKIGKKIGVFPIYEYWKDVGSLKDYVSANKENKIY